MVLDGDRRARLERSRAEGLLRTCFELNPADLAIVPMPFGITARSGDRAWIVSMSDDLAVLGGALVWIDRQQLAQVDLVVDHNAGIHARRAALLAPECRVWQAEESKVRPAEPEPIPPPRPRPNDTAHLESILLELGVEVVCEDGIVRGEIAGLEVARILHGPDGPVLEAGVGRFDREAGVLLNEGMSPRRAVANTVEQVRPHRVPGAVPHAVNRLARERWLRNIVVADPATADVEFPELVEPIPPRLSLLEVVPAALCGTDGGRSVLAVCSVGVDLGLVPAIADLIGVHEPDLVRIVVPERDHLPHLDRLVSRVPVPVQFRTITTPWQA